MKNFRNDWKRAGRQIAAAILMSVGIGACTETQYIKFSDDDADDKSLIKQVAYQIHPAFYSEFPECILVLPPSPTNKVSAELSSMIEAAISRHLGQKFDRVISGAERQIFNSRLDVSGSDPTYTNRLLKRLNCDTFLRTKVLDPRIDYLLVWSQVGIGLEMTLSRGADQVIVWQARHLAKRSEGGISFSPIGLLADTVFSTRFASDRDVVEGVIDDAIRRMLLPLPNVKSYSALRDGRRGL